MKTVGFVCPDTEAKARTTYEELGLVAQTVVREVAIAMGIDQAEYADRMTSDVIETARDAIFASLLTVNVADRDRFDQWQAEDQYAQYDVHLEGSEHVEQIVWHAASVDEQIVAATFQDERDAAIATLRGIAWGRVYRPCLRSSPNQ